MIGNVNICKIKIEFINRCLISNKKKFPSNQREVSVMFSHLFGKFLVPMKLGKKAQFFIKLGKNSVIFSQILQNCIYIIVTKVDINKTLGSKNNY